MDDKPRLEYRSAPPAVRDTRPAAERPIVAAAIVFSPIIISIVLLILYVLFSR